jgi:hypothetical protein
VPKRLPNTNSLEFHPLPLAVTNHPAVQFGALPFMPLLRVELLRKPRLFFVYCIFAKRTHIEIPITIGAVDGGPLQNQLCY